MSCLEQLDLWKSVSDKSTHGLDHCEVIASPSWFGVPTCVPHNEVELQTEFKSFTAAHLGSNTIQHTVWTLGGTCIKSSRSVYVPHLVQSVRFIYLRTERVTMLTLGSRANDYVKTLVTLGLWLHHSPCSQGCWTNNTLAARSLSPNQSFLLRFWFKQ